MNAMAMALVTAAEVPLDEEHVRPGFIAMGLVALLGVALFFLLRSFVKQLKKVDFEEQSSQDNSPDQSST